MKFSIIRPVLVPVTPGIHYIRARHVDEDQSTWRALCGSEGGAFGSRELVTCPQCQALLAARARVAERRHPR